MKIKRVNTVAFSPTGRTKKVMGYMIKSWQGSTSGIDLTEYKEEDRKRSFTEDELTFFGVPSYGGRVPDTAAKRLKNLKGNQTPAVVFVTYGNRAYEDTLLELKDLVEEQGFVVIAAAAVVKEHSIFPSFAAGRPDSKDRARIQEFGKNAIAKTEKCENAKSAAGISVKGNRPYKVYHTIPLTPKADKKCNGCLTCVRKCPVYAISEESPRKTDKDRCISCMRCVQNCPQKARKVSQLPLKLAQRKLKKVCAVKKESEWYL